MCYWRSKWRIKKARNTKYKVAVHGEGLCTNIYPCEWKYSKMHKKREGRAWRKKRRLWIQNEFQSNSNSITFFKYFFFHVNALILNDVKNIFVHSEQNIKWSCVLAMHFMLNWILPHFVCRAWLQMLCRNSAEILLSSCHIYQSKNNT